MLVFFTKLHIYNGVLQQGDTIAACAHVVHTCLSSG